jgi:hypothetical protein
MSQTEAASQDLRALGIALEQLLEVLAEPEAAPECLQEAWQNCARGEESMLEHLRVTREAPEAERKEMVELLQNVARLHGLALQVATKQHGEAADALKRARVVLNGLRTARTADPAGGSCDIAG